MAATGTSGASSVQPFVVQPEGSPPFGGAGRAEANVTSGLLKGVGFPAGKDTSILIPVRISGGLTLTTGVKVELLVADDTSDTAAVAGKAARFGATVGPITSGTSTPDENASTGPLASSTEVLANTTMPSTLGVLKVITLSVTTANANSLAITNWAFVKVRRNGTNAGDTDPGRVVLLGVDVYDY